MPTVNWDESGAYSLLPEGTYTCEIVEVTEEIKEKGPVWTIRLKVVDSPYAGQTFPDWWHLYGKALGKPKIAFRALGLKPEGKQNISPNQVIGRKADVTVTHGKRLVRRDNEEREVPTINVPFDGYRKPYGVRPAPDTGDETPPF